VIKEFKAGDYVEWKAEGARVRGAILKKVASPLKFKTQTVHASKKDPQYFIKPMVTGVVVVKKASALKKMDEIAGVAAKRAVKALKKSAKKSSK
jgi:hypothetical protein